MHECGSDNERFVSCNVCRWVREVCGDVGVQRAQRRHHLLSMSVGVMQDVSQDWDVLKVNCTHELYVERSRE